MQALKVATIVMGVMILLGTTALFVVIGRRLSHPVPPPTKAAASLVLDEPAGTRIATIIAVQDRLALQLQGGGPDRVVLIDPRSGAKAGEVSLAR
jgi:hypothetical protein